MDTIYALSTAQGKAGVAVIRISGERVLHVAEGICGTGLKPRHATLRILYDHAGQRLDEALVLYFPDKASFTGEPVVEFHTHGSRVIVARVLDRLSEVGFRPAEPGEFTRRALETGQLDLSQVEGLADLIDAETEEQRRQAVKVFDGALGGLVEAWRVKLVRAAALLEATIDFADEDVPENVFPEVRDLLMSVHGELVKEAEGANVRERVRDGFEVAIVGAPNTGKSTLLNRLAGRDAAITSEHAGTTRDVIEVRMDLMGLPVTFLDTAGLREAKDNVERIGIDVGRKRASRAGLRIYLMRSEDEKIMPLSSDDILLLGKADCQVGSTRHAAALRAGVVRLEEVLDRLSSDDSDEVDLLAEDVRAAIRAVDALVGRVDVETLLDEIFSSFCIGK
jgi:tRNA modification GTPase